VLFPLFLTGGFMQSVYSPLIIVLAAAVAVFLGFVPTSRLEEKFLRLLDQLNSKELGKKYGYFGHFYWQGGLDYKKGKDTRVYGAEGLIRGYCELGKKADRDWMKKATRVSTAQGLLNSLASGLIWAGAYVFVTLRAIAGSVSIGMVIQYANALNNFTWGLTSLAQAFSQFAVTSKRQQSTLDYMNYPDVLHKGTLPVEKRRDNEYEIEFKDVSFKYPGSDNYALKNLNLKLNVGQKLAVVGMNGSGKTTMIKLLCRLYDPTGGVITLNGYDIKKYDYREYMSVFSVVFQDFKLFSFPLGQNVAAGSDYDEDRVLDSLRLAGLSDRYTALAKGLDTPLYSDYEEGGVEISGGEAQKIAIARALYKGSTFVVLDEPTAALDPIAEFDIYSRFNDMINGKTAIYISHRLSSCRFCDDIAVFHEGRLIQRGSHDSLLKDEQGKYHELWNAQAQDTNKE
jgi:ATP-binding cassette subfamily B protein